MKKTILFSSVLVALALMGCTKTDRVSTASNDNPPPPADTSTAVASNTNTNTMPRNVGEPLNATAANLASTGRTAEWKLTAEDIKDDVAAGRKIERSKAGAPTGGVENKSDLKKSVEARLHGDTEVGNIPVDVDADHDGTINLSGKANSIDQIGRAMSIAMDTEGVTKVTSEIKIDKDGNAHR